MNISGNAKYRVLSILSILVVLCTITWTQTQEASAASNLDLAGIARFNYSGVNAADNKTPCFLNVSEIARDFSGRFYQDYRTWLDGHSEANFSIRLRGSSWVRTPDRVDTAGAQFSIPMDVFILVLVTDPSNPTQVREFHLVDASGLSSPPAILLQCEAVKSTPR